MIVYQLKGIVAQNDWATRPESQDLGLFISEELAQQLVDEVKSRPDWRMDWDDFEIVERTVAEFIE